MPEISKPERERLELLERLQDLAARTGKGQGETVRLEIELPKEWVLLAAWLEIVERVRQLGRSAVCRPVELEAHLF